MAYDTALADRVRTALADLPDVQEKAMFGGLAFMVSGRMVAAANGDGVLMVRCAPERTEELLQHPGTSRPTMGTRTMSAGWVVIDAEHLAAPTAVADWVQHGLDARPST